MRALSSSPASARTMARRVSRRAARSSSFSSRKLRVVATVAFSSFSAAAAPVTRRIAFANGNEGDVRAHGPAARVARDVEAPGGKSRDGEGTAFLDLTHAAHVLGSPAFGDLARLALRDVAHQVDHGVAARRLRAHGLGCVRLRPAAREAHLEAEAGVQEDVADEHSGLGALSDRKAVDVGEQRAARVGQLGIALPAQLAGLDARHGRALGRQRVGVEVAGAAQVTGLELLVVHQRLEKAREGARVVADGRAQDLAIVVGAALEIARIGRHPPRAEHRVEQRELPTRGSLLSGRVAFGHVADLVTDHAGQLVLVVGHRQQAARHVDVSPGEREGVRLDLIDDPELVRERPIRNRAQQLVADGLHVGVERGIAEQPDLRLDALGGLTAGVAIVVGRVQKHGAIRTRDRGQRGREHHEGQRGEPARAHGRRSSQVPSPSHLAFICASSPVSSSVFR